MIPINACQHQNKNSSMTFKIVMYCERKCIGNFNPSY